MWTTRRLIQFDDPMKKATGLAVFHYTTHLVNETAQKYVLDRVGGYYRRGYSKVAMDAWTILRTRCCVAWRRSLIR